MRIIDQYRVQTILGLLQVGTILVGSIAVGAILKMMGFTDGQEMNWLVLFVRNWGFVFMLIPVLWVFMTIWMELQQSSHSKATTLVTGLLLLALLICFFILVAARASSVLTRMST